MATCPRDDRIGPLNDRTVSENEHRNEALTRQAPDFPTASSEVWKLREAIGPHDAWRVSGRRQRVKGPLAGVRPGSPRGGPARPGHRKCSPADVQPHAVVIGREPSARAGTRRVSRPSGSRES